MFYLLQRPYPIVLLIDVDFSSFLLAVVFHEAGRDVVDDGLFCFDGEGAAADEGVGVFGDARSIPSSLLPSQRIIHFILLLIIITLRLLDRNRLNYRILQFFLLLQSNLLLRIFPFTIILKSVTLNEVLLRGG